MNKKLIIYEKVIDLHKLESKITEGAILHKDKIYLIYDAKVSSPPFFKLIVILKPLTDNDIKMAYNMLLVGGKLLFSENLLEYFLNLRLKHSQFEFSLKEDKYITIIKKNNFQFIFEAHRTVEFIIIGAQKGGTTSLSLNISKQPDIYINKNEPIFLIVFPKTILIPSSPAFSAQKTASLTRDTKKATFLKKYPK